MSAIKLSTSIPQLIKRVLSTEAAIAFQPTKVAVRTSQNDPTHHKKEDCGKFYTLPEKTRMQLFAKWDLPLYYERYVETFHEANILVREPAVEMIDYLSRANYSRPVIRYALYGKFGAGKTMTLVHTLNYAVNNDFIVVYVPQLWKWYHYSKEVAPSEVNPEMLELPLDAAAFLKNFEMTNSALIKKLDLKVSQTYEWSHREKTAEGAPLSELVSHGINRVKFACRVIDALFQELKKHACNDKCRVFVAIDGYNGFFQTSSKLKTAEGIKFVPATNSSLTKSFLSLTKNDWNNGAAVLVIDDHACVKGEFNSYFPFHLLRKDGVESIDPFIPIYVPEFSPLEFQNYLDYFEEKRWLQKPEGRDEIEFVTQRNPRLINTYCANR